MIAVAEEAAVDVGKEKLDVGEVTAVDEDDEGGVGAPVDVMGIIGGPDGSKPQVLAAALDVPPISEPKSDLPSSLRPPEVGVAVAERMLTSDDELCCCWGVAVDGGVGVGVGMNFKGEDGDGEAGGRQLISADFGGDRDFPRPIEFCSLFFCFLFQLRLWNESYFDRFCPSGLYGGDLRLVGPPPEDPVDEVEL